MRFLKVKSVKEVFSGKKQISKEALEVLDRRIGVFLEKLVSETRDKRISPEVVSYFKM